VSNLAVAPPLPAHLPLVPGEELARRAETLAARLAAGGFDGAFLLHPSSLFWIAGTLTDGWPYLTADGRVGLPLRTSVSRAKAESPIPQAPIRRFGDLPGALADLGLEPSGVVGIETDVVPVAVLERLRRTFPDADFRDVSGLVREVRAVKSDYEIEWIERAGRLVDAVMDEALPGEIRPGVREIELQAFVECELRLARHQGTVRVRRWNLEMHFGTVSAGDSACAPCYFDGPDGLEGLYPAVQQGGGERRVEPGVPVLVDFVGAAGGYLADRARVFCVGDPPAEALEAHEFCRGLLAEITDRLRPGAIPARIWDDVVAIVDDSPWRDRFMGWGENRVRFLGHGVGLDLDELPIVAPRFETPLAPGHVLAIEPKVFLAGLGGVGVENTYVVTTDGCRNVTPGPEEIRVLPARQGSPNAPRNETP
jgi:Xaa-Pro aminopeptidase